MRRWLMKKLQGWMPPGGSQSWRGLPLWIVADVAAMNVFGLLMILAASSVPYVGTPLKGALKYSQWSSFEHQLLWLAVGSLLMWFVAIVDYRKVAYRLRRVLPMLTIALLLVVLAIGLAGGGSRRWITVPISGLLLQPSELMKLAAVICGASMLSRDEQGLVARRKRALALAVAHTQLTPRTTGPFGARSVSSREDVLAAAAAIDMRGTLRRVVVSARYSSKYARYLFVVLLAVALVLAEPDLGTSALLLAIAGGMLFLGGATFRWLCGAAGFLVAVLLGSAMSFSYQRNRLLASSLFSSHSSSLVRLASAAHPSQLGQSIASLASGGVSGTGLGTGWGRWAIPNAHTDFIFAIIGQQAGFIGCMVVIVGFGALAWFGMRAAQRAPDRFGSLLAGGITWWIIVQAFVNIGAVCGFLPITGVPLPFFSYGGTSLIVLMVAVGLVVNVASLGSRERIPRPRGVPADGARVLPTSPGWGR